MKNLLFSLSSGLARMALCYSDGTKAMQTPSISLPVALKDSVAHLLSRLRCYFPSWWVLVLVPLANVAAILAAQRIAQLGQLDYSPVFPAPAILIIAFLRTRPATWPALIVASVAVELTASVQGPIVSAHNCLMGTLESLLIAGLLRKFADLRTWFLSMRWMLMCVCFSLLGVSVASAVGAAVIYATGHPSWQYVTLPVFGQITATETISIALVTPLLLSWTEPALRNGLRSWRLVQAIAFIGVAAGGASAAFLLSNNIATLFLIFPLLALLTLRTGLPGATAGAVAVTGVSTYLTVKGVGPIATYPDLDVGGRLLFLQLYFIAALLSSIPLAIIQAARAGLSNKVKQQGAISDAALSNMAQGLSMFDKDDLLITCNQRFAELYGLPRLLTEPMTPLEEIMEHSHGVQPWAKLKAYVREMVGTGDPSRASSDVELADGRIISIYCRPLDDSGWVATHEDVTQRRLAEDRISFLATHDPLTGLSNRSNFNDRLQGSLAQTQRGQAFALHALDLDRFKAVNDTLGHSAGDELLKQVAARLQEAVRGGDVVARLGGDEFAILQFGFDKPDEARALATRIVKVLGTPFLIEGQEVGIGTSIGIALAPKDSSDPAELMQKSDVALCRAKAEGRNTYRFYEAGMDAAQQAHQALEADLRAALKNEEFELYYQPIVNTQSGAITCFEALIRWHHPTRGLVAPADFIKVAEDCKLIQPIGEFVLRAACREATNWPSHIRVSVNLSPVQFQGRNPVPAVRRALKEAQLDPRRLELEITESTLLQNSQFVMKSLHQLREIGVAIVMDDFGTGYSSLSYLRSFPFDKIKIDRSFIAGLQRKDDSLAIVHAAIEISRRLGMTSTAEGVETAEEYAVLAAEGCNEIQGYYISRPLPARRLPQLLARRETALVGALAAG